MTTTRTALALATTSLLAVPVALVAAAPAVADIERSTGCGGAVAELAVDRENGGWEVDADVDRAAPGSQWRVVLRHDGAKIADRVLRADREGELDLDRFRRDTAGRDAFRLTVDPTGAAGPCRTRLVVR